MSDISNLPVRQLIFEELLQESVNRVDECIAEFERRYGPQPEITSKMREVWEQAKRAALLKEMARDTTLMFRILRYQTELRIALLEDAPPWYRPQQGPAIGAATTRGAQRSI